MTIADVVYHEVKHLGIRKQAEILDFVRFLKQQRSMQRSTTRTEDAGLRKKRTPKFGSAKGKIRLSKDFDAPLEDMREYME